MNSSKGIFLVTGGSRGIGAATAIRAAGAGYAVAIFYRERASQADEVLRTIEKQGGQAMAVKADVGDEDSLMRAFEAVDKAGRLEILVNNAGVTGGMARLQDVTAAALLEVNRVNVVGAFLASREAVRRMSTRNGGQGGAIVNVSSGASQIGSPNTWIHYAATKGAMDTLTIGLAKEVGGEGIRVNAVRPGLINTEIQQGRTATQLDVMMRAIPMGRMGSAEEIAQTIVWLASNEASYVTGCLLDARGGM
jgi:NAD(P)-dependent dehydrogenase (short-subunit alcohol dehydrogenase family)